MTLMKTHAVGLSRWEEAKLKSRIVAYWRENEVGKEVKSVSG